MASFLYNQFKKQVLEPDPIFEAMDKPWLEVWMKWDPRGIVRMETRLKSDPFDCVLYPQMRKKKWRNIGSRLSRFSIKRGA